MTGVVPEDGRVPVEEVRGEVHHDRQLSELLQKLTRGNGRVVARTTSYRKTTVTDR